MTPGERFPGEDGDEFAEPRHREDDAGVIWTLEPIR